MQRESSGSLEAPTIQAELKYALVEFGAQFVTTHGA